MSRRLETLLKPFLSASAEDQLKLVQGIRRRKFTEKPAVVARQTRARKKVEKTTTDRLSRILAGLPPEELAAMLEKLKSD